jgi:hypothetical protein
MNFGFCQAIGTPETEIHPDPDWQLYGIATLNHPDQHNRDRQDEQDVNEPPQRVRTHYAEQPEDEQQHEDGPQHSDSPPEAQLANLMPAQHVAMWPG